MIPVFLDEAPTITSLLFKSYKPINLTKFSPESTTVKSLSTLLIIIFSPIVNPLSTRFNLNDG